MGTNDGNIEWHQTKIREYFEKCFGEVYNPFLEMSTDLIKALSDFVNDETHTGPEAESAKKFVTERQIKLAEDTIYCIQKLQSMMQGTGFESEVALLEDFKADLSEDDTAVVKMQHLDKIIDDFAGYKTVYNEIHPKITGIYKEVKSIAASCSVISRKDYTWPETRDCHVAFDALTTIDKNSGCVPEFKKKFLAFHEEHSNDIEGSAFKNLLDTIVSNLHQIVDGMNKGALDITKFDRTKENISWKDPKDILAPEDAEEYLKFFKS